MSLLLVYFALSVVPPELGRWEPLGEWTSSYLRSPVLDEGGSVADYVPSPVRFDIGTGRLEPFAAGGEYVEQSDCGAGLFSVFRAEAPPEPGRGALGRLETYRISDGKLLSRVPGESGSVERVGGVVRVVDRNRYGRPRKEIEATWFDARTGDEIATTKGVWLVWDSPTVRLGLEELGGNSPPFYHLNRYKPGTFELDCAAPVGPFDQSFERFIGEPGRGVFALEFGFVGVGVANFSVSVVGAGFTAIPVEVEHVWDASELGILAGLKDHGYPTPSGQDRYPDLACLDPVTGQVRWSREIKGVHPQWVGHYVALTGEKEWHFLDAKTGEDVGRIASPGRLIVNRGDLYVFGLGTRQDGKIKYGVFRLELSKGASAEP
jgi:hypothetical protein